MQSLWYWTVVVYTLQIKEWDRYIFMLFVEKGMIEKKNIELRHLKE